MGKELTKKEEVMKNHIAEIQSEINRLTRNLQLARQACACRVMIKTKWDTARCEVCGTGYGHWCPDSPNNHCDYGHDEDYDPDECRYCGHPEERQ